MGKNLKQLLLKDLCVRLPYLTKVKCPFDDEPYTLLSINWDKEIVVIGLMNVDTYVTSKQKLVNIKPYLRPMSSMTEDEIVELKWLNEKCDAMPTFEYVPVENYRIYDWMNRHHFDYRGLIERGLAIEAPEGMYNYNL